jgi:hypothetical protein
MTRLALATLALTALAAAGPAVSRPVRPPRAVADVCCRVPAGVVVEIALADRVSTKHQKTGDMFALKLAEPLIFEHRVLALAGAPGVGEVIQATRPGMGGKPAKLVLAARYLDVRGRRIPLEGLQLAASGKSNAMAAQVVGLSGIAFGPLGFIGLAVPGGNVDFPAGTAATAELAGDVVLTSLGAAPRGAANAEFALRDPGASGQIAIGPPPRGKGQVVFFRARSLLGTGQWFKVRENGAALGKLSNGAYFIRVTDPGVHVYTAATEPEAKDKLRLEVDPGETYYVEGQLTKGVAIGVPDIAPSDRAAFDKASKSLKLAPPPEAEAAGAGVSATNAAE